VTIINVNQLKEGDVLEKDIYRGNALVLKAGSILTNTVIAKLKKWDKGQVEISKSEDESNLDTFSINEIESLASEYSVSKLKDEFFNSLINFGHEYRYGIALHQEDDFQWLESLYIKFMMNIDISRLIRKLKKWDYESYLHSLDVFILGSLFARKLELDDVESFALGCLLHDIGKLDIPRDILNKPSQLSFKEYELIKNHTIYGYKILKRNNFSEDIALLAKYHHERGNGNGYPEGLTDVDLEDEIKILSIVDVYSALTLNRPYRRAYGSTKAQRILLNECKMVDKIYFYKFFKMLNIFPLDSTVELTNGTRAKIVYINDKIPDLPIFEDMYKLKRFSIPLNRSLRIKKVIKL